MALKLLHFPYVILFEILRTTEFRDIFTLSVCSSKMYRVIKSVNLKANAIHYEMDRDKTNVFTYNVQNKHEDMLILKTIPIFDIRKQPTHLKIGGMKISCMWSNYTIECLPVYPNIIQKAITNHVRGLFKFAPDIDLEFSSFNVALKLFPEIEQVTDSCLGKVSIDTNTIEQFMLLYPNQKSVTIKGEIEGHLSPHSTLYQVENLYFHDSRYIASPIFENFTGRCLLLRRAIMETPAETQIIGFIKQWISGEKFQNLDLLDIRLHEVSGIHYFNETPVLNEFRTVTKEWDGSGRPEIFRYQARLFEYNRKGLLALKCDDALDVQRLTDGVWASFKVFESEFLFAVWK